jgi:NAD(P)-dependent dehydrogenase (short-subunit alcohol dehydrogenase family)
MGVALVTGCSTGIGFATALHLGRAGFDVVATMRNPDKDGAPLLEAAHDTGSQIRLAALDVCHDDSVERAFADAGDLDVLVNNAAIVCSGSMEETTITEWQDVFETNLFGAVRCMRAVLPGMRTRGGGCIVNVSSAAGSVALPAVGAYAASKAALETASEIAAIEGVRFGIRVVVIETGATATAMGAKIQVPPKTSPYWDPMRNTFAWLGAQRPQISRRGSAWRSSFGKGGGGVTFVDASASGTPPLAVLRRETSQRRAYRAPERRRLRNRSSDDHNL